ncbi:enoyl-CoA hydratase-related protein [Bacillus sp. FSL W7-1360]
MKETTSLSLNDLLKQGPLITAVEDHCAWLYFNRPEAANALSLKLLKALKAQCEKIKEDRDIRVVVLTAATGKVFCAGADLKERAAMTEEEAIETVKLIGETVEALASLPQPVIVAAAGHAFGGGLELCLAGDVRLFAKDAQYGLTETRLAIIPGAGGTQRLPRLIGPGKAKELIYTGRRISGAEAYAIGLCEHAVPVEEMATAARALAIEMAQSGPLALQAAKQAIDASADLPLAEGLRREHEAYQTILHTNDRLEGLAAFKEKRQPIYKGN